MRETLFYTVTTHTIIDFGIVWRELPAFSITGIRLGRNGDLVSEVLSENPGIQEKEDRRIRKLRTDLLAFLDGERVTFDTDDFDLARLSEFEQGVLRTLITVPRGAVVSYRELAERCRVPRGARAVGNVMRKNPFPLVYPCHRVVKSGGRIGNYQPGQSVKIQLLKLEEVDLSAFKW